MITELRNTNLVSDLSKHCITYINTRMDLVGVMEATNLTGNSFLIGHLLQDGLGNIKVEVRSRQGSHGPGLIKILGLSMNTRRTTLPGPPERVVYYNELTPKKCIALSQEALVLGPSFVHLMAKHEKNKTRVQVCLDDGNLKVTVKQPKLNPSPQDHSFLTGMIQECDRSHHLDVVGPVHSVLELHRLLNDFCPLYMIASHTASLMMYVHHLPKDSLMRVFTEAGLIHLLMTYCGVSKEEGKKIFECSSTRIEDLFPCSSMLHYVVVIDQSGNGYKITPRQITRLVMKCLLEEDYTQEII